MSNNKIWIIMWPLRCYREVLRGMMAISELCFKKASGGSVKNACPVSMAKDPRLYIGKQYSSRQKTGMKR